MICNSRFEGICRLILYNSICNSSEKSERCFAFQFVCLSLWDIRTNTESVSLFSLNERRKFDREENEPTSCRVLSLYGIGVGLLLILFSWFPTTSLAKVSFRHHAFCLIKSKINRRIGARATNLNLLQL